MRAEMGEKMSAILTTHMWHRYQPKVDLVHQSRGLQGVTRLFSAHVPAREPVQFILYHRNQFLVRNHPLDPML
jgi:hypothetical protein